MPLLALWQSNPIAVGDFNIEQVVATAGDGSLRDGSLCASEFRDYLSQVTTEKLALYVDQCLSSSLTKGGIILQDLVNEIGRRLDYDVTNGRYQGISSQIGFDGIWRSPEGHSIVAEVKTTDAYRISLETLATYRDRLLGAGQIHEPSSVLIVVGRQDTGELEAQIRGSRYAWDVRLISAEALLKLARLKESTEGAETGQKIRSLLTPMEYTRLDEMVDVMFTTATDVESTTVASAGPEAYEDFVPGNVTQPAWAFTDTSVLQSKRENILAAVETVQAVKLVRKSRALYWSSNHEIRVACTISKRYEKRSSYPYWYAFHPQWRNFLHHGTTSYLILGCMDLDIAFAIPGQEIVTRLEYLNATIKEDGTPYWHIHLAIRDHNQFVILLPKHSSYFEITSYQIRLT